VYIYICVCVYMYVYIYIYIYTHIRTYTYKSIYTPSSVSVFKNRCFPYIFVAWSPIITPVFPRFMTRFDHSGWDHVAGLSFPHFPSFAQITLSSVQLRLSLSAVDCFCASWHEAVLQSTRVTYLTRSKIVCMSLQMTLQVLYAFGVTLYFYYP
jgi:hypothetical protein